MRSGRGLSLKTQAIYVFVFVTRYIDVLYRWVSVYNTFMKIFYIASSIFIIWLAFWKYRPMDDEESTDTMPIVLVLVPPALLALVFNYSFSPIEILWSYSIFLEALAILPQLWMLRRTGQCEALTRYYIFCLGGYRAFYIGNWIWRFSTEGMYDPIAISGGIVQTALNFYFIYVYLQKYPNFEDIERPGPIPLPTSDPDVPPPPPPKPSTAGPTHPPVTDQGLQAAEEGASKIVAVGDAPPVPLAKDAFVLEDEEEA
ncbi:hypothetical protein HWV62_36721 [Athelia sp. TMB]|nr:hypothetical protein HWV62_36721 [Athelia sp. TMB]